MEAKLDFVDLSRRQVSAHHDIAEGLVELSNRYSAPFGEVSL